MSKLVFASFLKIFKDAMSYRLNKNDIIIKLYDIVLDPVKERQPQVAPAQATRIFDCEEEVNTNVSKHAYDQLVLDSLKCSVDSVIFGEMSNKNKTQFIQRLKDIITDDSTIPYEEKERLLRYADEKEYELFVGYSLLYSFSVPNVPVTDTAKKKIKELLTNYSKNKKGRPQEETREKMICWLKDDNIRKTIEDQITALQSSQMNLRETILKRFEEEKSTLPSELVSNIEQKFKDGEDSKAILLLILGNIYGKNISSLSFLYTDSEQKQEPPKEVPVAMSEYAKCVLATRLPSTLTKIESVFSFRSDKIAFQGRKEERNRLESWLNQGFVSVWAVTGQGGSGKSKLALCFAADMEKQRKAKAVWMDKALLKQFLEYNDFSYSQPVLFICDYASQFGDQLKDLIDKMSWTQTNAKFLLLERSDVWYRDFLLKNDAVKERAVKEPIILDHLDFEPDEYAAIMQDYSDALNDKEPKQIPEAAQQQIIQKAKELSGKENSVRCLFLLLVTDAYLKNPDIRHLNAQNLLHNYLNHSREILKKHYDEELISAGYRVLAYATACDGIRFSEMKNHPSIQNEWETIKKQLKGRQQINHYFQRMSEIDEKDTVPAMKPDLIGEFLFLHEWNDLMDDEQADWLSCLLKEEYSHAFFAMCLSDWQEESEALCEMFSDSKGDVEQRAACANVFNLAVHTAHFEYVANIKALDYDCSSAVLAQYTNAIHFIFEHTAKDTKTLCIFLLNEVRWNDYSGETDEELQHLARAYSDIAIVYHNIGYNDKALVFYHKTLAISERVLGPEHPSTATTYNNIAGVYQAMSDYSKALEFYQKALAISEIVLGPEHPSTTVIYNNIAVVYKDRGDYSKALEFHQKALAISEKVLGTEHPDTAIAYDNIALLYREMSNYSKALEFHQKALAISEIVLGTEHPDTAITYNNIALLYQEMSDYSKALEFYQKALAISEKVLGTEHPSTAMTYSNIAIVHKAMSNYPKALEFYNKALATCEKVLGTEHPYTATAYSNIAGVYQAMGDYPKALEFFNKALAIRETVLGTEHPNNATDYSNIAGVYQAIGEKYYNKALEYKNKALEYKNKALEYKNKALEYKNKALEYKNKALEYINKSSEYNNKALEYINKALEYHNKASEFFN